MAILGSPGAGEPPVLETTLKTTLKMTLNTTLKMTLNTTLKMALNTIRGRPGPVDVNGFKCLSAAMYLGVVGPCVFIVQPAFVQGLVAVLGFDESRAGYVAAAEMWGIALATLALTLMPRLFGHWRHTLLGAALTAAVAARRFGQLPPLVLGVTASVGSLLMLLGMPFGAWRYLLAVSVYNYAWNMTHPFLLAALAGFDGAGRILARGVAAQILGLALGPALAAYVLSSEVLSGVLSGGGYAAVIWLGALFFVAALFMIVPALRLKQRRG